MHRVTDSLYLINGHADPEETLPLLGHELPENMEFDTMSGFVVDLLGYIPEARENPSVQWENIRFTVLNMEENWISRIKRRSCRSKRRRNSRKLNKGNTAQRLCDRCVVKFFVR